MSLIQFNKYEDNLKTEKKWYQYTACALIIVKIEDQDKKKLYTENIKVISFNDKAKAIEPNAKSDDYMCNSFPLLFDTRIPSMILECYVDNEPRYIGDIVISNSETTNNFIKYHITMIPIKNNEIIIQLNMKNDTLGYDKMFNEQICDIISHMQKLKDNMLIDAFNIEDLRKYVIDSICDLTKSKYGYIAKCVYKNDTCENIRLVSFGGDVIKDASEELVNTFNLCKETIVSGKLAFTNIKYDNPYSKSLFTKVPSIYNNSDMPLRKEENSNTFCPFKPHGKIMHNYCSIPITFADRVICVIGLACKEDDYTIELINSLYKLLDMYANIEISFEHLKYLKTMKQSLVEANEAKSNFLSNLSHELRTPMNGIIVAAEMISRNDDITDTYREFINCIQKSAENMMNLLNDLFQMTRIDAKSIKVETSEINIKSEIKNIIQLFSLSKQKEQKYKKIRLLSNIDEFDDNEIIVCDIKLFNQIINNILSNAFKFTDRGFIEILISIIEHKGIRCLKIEIEDTGIGISEENISKIFDRFTQINNNKRTTIGAGIGLSLVKSILNLINGEISVKSKVNEGTTFTIIMPIITKNIEIISEIDMTHLKEEYDKTQTSLPKKYIVSDKKAIERKKENHKLFSDSECPNVVIVEDIPSNQDVLKWLLKSYNVNTIKICDNGQIFIDWMADNYLDVDLIFMDAHMPVLDGYDATKLWREYESKNELQRTNIIGLSASVIRGSEKGLNSGMDMFIEKPIKSYQIEEIIHKIKEGKIRNPYKDRSPK